MSRSSFESVVGAPQSASNPQESEADLHIVTDCEWSYINNSTTVHKRLLVVIA